MTDETSLRIAGLFVSITGAVLENDAMLLGGIICIGLATIAKAIRDTKW